MDNFNFIKKFFYFWTTNHGFFILVLLFTSSFSFFLGKISVIGYGQKKEFNQVVIQYSEKKEDFKVVASKKGSVYHLPWCPGALRMKEENKIFFKNKEEAESKGYRPAKNCEGL